MITYLIKVFSSFAILFSLYGCSSSNQTIAVSGNEALNNTNYSYDVDSIKKEKSLFLKEINNINSDRAGHTLYDEHYSYTSNDSDGDIENGFIYLFMGMLND